MLKRIKLGLNLDLARRLFCMCPLFARMIIKFLSLYSLDLNVLFSCSSPNSLGDDLIIEVRDSKGQHLGGVVAQLAAIADDPVRLSLSLSLIRLKSLDNEELKSSFLLLKQTEKGRWWPIYHEPEHELIGRIQLHLSYSSSLDGKTKCGLVAETSAYDLVLEVAMKAERFQRRNLVFKGPWRWMITRFASYYGISDAYTSLR